MLNSIILMGRLTDAPDLRHTQSGTPVASFTIAVDRNTGDRQTDFVPCVAWRQTGEFVSNHFRKGSLICVQGSLQSRKWEDRDGNKRTSWEIVVDRAHFTGEKKDAVSIEPPDFTELSDDEDIDYPDFL